MIKNLNVNKINTVAFKYDYNELMVKVKVRRLDNKVLLGIGLYIPVVHLAMKIGSVRY